MQSQKQILGTEGERIAERYLKKKGFTILERNYRCPIGELDLIVLDRRVVVFVEVKTRSDGRFGSPLESVHRHKQKRMIKAAQASRASGTSFGFGASGFSHAATFRTARCQSRTPAERLKRFP